VAIKLKPNLPQAHINLASVLGTRHDFAQAESEAREVVRLAPEDSEAHRTLARTLSFRGNLPNLRSLEAWDIPHLLVASRSFHQREEVETLRAASVAIEWPDDELAVYAALRGPFA
jgi:hypothetical protein